MTFMTRPEIQGTFGVIASTHWLASACGMAALERGGNAFDAAVAAGFVLQVVEPHLNGPGGEVPIILNDAASGRQQVICGQGVAPAAATIERYRDLGLDLVPGSGLLATVVPGAFDAWMLLLRDHGTLRPCEVLEFAIGYAEGGYPLVSGISAKIALVRDLFEKEWPTSAAVYLPGGDVPAPGSRFRNSALAATYRRLLDEAEAKTSDRDGQIEALRAAWYRGFVAEAIDAFCRETEWLDTSGKRHGGLLTADDMAAWHATKEAPVTYDCWGHTFCKTRPWGQGPVFLQQLALLADSDLASLDPLGPEFVHLETEAAKLAFADREAFYGDPDFVEVPLETLLSRDYNEDRRRLISDSASLELRPGQVPGHAGKVDVEAAVRRLRTRTGFPRRWRTDPGGRHRGRRHLSSRRGRPPRQHGIGHALGRLAARLADHPVARVLSQHAGPDVLARGGPSGEPRTGQTPAHHSVRQLGAARWRALHGVRHPRRRLPRPVDRHLRAPPPAPRHEPPGSDRRAGFPDRPPGRLFLAARCRSRLAHHRGEVP